MKLDEIVALLRPYGLSDQEARAFFHLAKQGEATAAELARASGLNRADVYRAADGLEGKGLIQRTMDRPQRFIPQPIDEALTELIDQENKRLERLGQEMRTIVEHWPASDHPDAVEEELRFQVRQGRAMIEGEFRRMIERATREVSLAAPHRTVNRLLTWGLGKMLKEALARGCRVRILTQLVPDLLSDDSGIPDGCELRHSEVPVYAQFLIVDQREIAAYVTADPVVGTTGRPETVLWLNSPDYSLGQQTLFDDLWDESTDPETRRLELETGFLPNQMEVQRGRLARVDQMRAMIRSADRELLLALDPDEAARLATLRIPQALEQSAKRGIAVRVLIDGTAKSFAAIPGVEARPGGLHEGLVVLVRDGAEAVLVPRSGATERAQPKRDPSRDSAHERSIKTTVPSAIEMVRSAFLRAWEN